MKKFLLSMVALMAIAVGVNAQTSYTVEGYVRSALLPVQNSKGDTVRVDTLGIGGYTWDSLYHPLVTFDTPRTIEIYADSIIINDWYGYGVNEKGRTYALKCERTDSMLTKFSTRIGSTEHYYYGYVYTGYEDNDKMFVGFSTWTSSYAPYTQCKVDDETKSGYIFMVGTEWYSGIQGYYFITWGDADKFFETAKGKESPSNTTEGTLYNYYESYGYKVLGNATTATVEEYTNDSTIIRSWCGVEGYDLAIIGNTNAGITRLVPIVNGVPNYYSAGGYDYIYTGLSDWAMALQYDNYVYFWDADGYRYLILTPYVYNDTKMTTQSTDNYNYCIYWKISDDTSVGAIKAETTEANGPIFNLAGQRVGKDAKGLLIKNGKKILVK